MITVVYVEEVAEDREDFFNLLDVWGGEESFLSFVGRVIQSSSKCHDIKWCHNIETEEFMKYAHD